MDPSVKAGTSFIGTTPRRTFMMPSQFRKSSSSRSGPAFLSLASKLFNQPFFLSLQNITADSFAPYQRL
jgi:hypothetical protein